ncbi:MAG: hypothetical protein A3B74_04430 [Candidatus Kerfeldbacteria bacterium RIFCSPHIGHO2_02_FULL_42_14]|uniref:Uncharacterized protein n=1 Tax=Candidatus Kerfeldbacteria bacterium RIFCSPHIGHO2_02_FULL_42_14 TaxID=1798540 RepID=A0A1G2ARE9_9BACT|nr:MAG: hypothetical protein A3B74_04430 [Candidatus Kerfeldbacteria bacterium RIFCSPHIGHO2_02_FULL_42_14]OGY80817.1 MAG: hypothetical protein A3E60_01390 [Candidatus Kerfeldbacteria bacterium RIFCSPHIGHO2_12_FULL_42_13]OGY84989.1 MAG: hypothetical protein A3I91_00725 [Candidatus Kerfeldbacteria bacterium RIFCSPLOWO2_02_FULL_42_19]OGY86156.1 MAG: hypothetical protein A3G01_02260 [Candidatus Kerfeldbacteria bacterium RIFCSPLOWO2_12_FULL_43_9]
MSLQAAKLIVVHITRGIFFDILYFPIWWITRGITSAVKISVNWMRHYAHRFALLILLKNLHKPMFGQTDWQSRIISFFVRLVQFVVLTAGWIVWCAIISIVTLVWILMPFFILWAIMYQLTLVRTPPFSWWL